MLRHGGWHRPCPGASARRVTNGPSPPVAVVAIPGSTRSPARRCQWWASGPSEESDPDHISVPRKREYSGTLDLYSDHRGRSPMRETLAVQCQVRRPGTPPPQRHQHRRSLVHSLLLPYDAQALRRRPHTRQSAVQEDDDGDHFGRRGGELPSSRTPRAFRREQAPGGDTRRRLGALTRRPTSRPPSHPPA